MTLRARLFVLVALIVAVLVAAGTVVVDRQRDVLVAGLDQRLLSEWTLSGTVAAGPATAGTATELHDTAASNGSFRAVPMSNDTDPDAPLSDLYLAVVLPDGMTKIQVSGLLLADTPDLSSLDLGALDAETFATVAGEKTDQQFRVLLVPADDGTVTVLAKPTTSVEVAVQDLARSMLLSGVTVTALLIVLVWWVMRLGIRPIDRLTVAATAATAGPGAPRVEAGDARTEAGRLALAFNAMLDQRDGADARLRRFVADASHELRTPLTSVEGYLDLLIRGGVDRSDFEDVLHRMRRESHRMRDLVEDLLLLTHLDEGRPLRRERVDLAALARDVALDASVVHPERRIGFIVDEAVVALDGTEPVTAHVVLGDEARLHQVVAGILGNALVHTPPEASIELRVWADASGRPSVTVADDGPGVDRDTAATIFDRFSRGDSSRSRQGQRGGFGLGLAIARSITEAHGGQLTLETGPGEGCVFTMTLPSPDLNHGIREPRSHHRPPER